MKTAHSEMRIDLPVLCFALFFIAWQPTYAIHARYSLESEVQVSEDDPLFAVLTAYDAAVGSLVKTNPTTQQRMEFRTNWLERLRTAVDANSGSTHRDAALGKIVGLANGLGKFDLAKLYSEQLASGSADPVTKARWTMEKAEILLEENAGMPQKERTASAVEDLLRAYDLASLRSTTAAKCLCIKTITIAAEHCQTAAQGKLVAPKIKVVLDSYLRDDEARNESALQGLSDVRLRVAALSVYAKMGDEASVNAIITDLAKADKPPEQELWISVLQAGDIMYPTSEKPRINFLDRWKDLSPFLLFHLARAKFEHGDFASTIENLQVLREKHKLELLEKDRGILSQKQGGYFAEVLLNLALSQLKLKKLREAEESLDQAKVIASRDPRIPLIENEIANFRAELTKGKPTSRALSGSRIMWGIVILGIVGVVVFLSRRKMRNSSLLIVLALLASVVGCSTKQASGSSNKKDPDGSGIKEQYIDLGKVESGQQVQSNFTFLNLSNSPAVLRVLKGSCNCLAGGDFPVTVQAGEEKRIPFYLDTRGKADGIFESRITLVYDLAGEVQQGMVRITADVIGKSYLTATPAYIYMEPDVKVADKSVRIKLEGRKSESLGNLSISKPSWINVQLLEPDNHLMDSKVKKEWVLRLELAEQGMSGHFYGEVQLKSEFGDYQLNIPVTAKFQSGIVASPDAVVATANGHGLVTIKPVDGGKLKFLSCDIKNEQDATVDVERADAAENDLCFTVKPSSSKAIQTGSVTFNIQVDDGVATKSVSCRVPYLFVP